MISTIYLSLAVIHFPTANARLLSIILLFGCPSFFSYSAASPTPEQANLGVMLRQLNALEDTAHRSAQITGEPGKRYAFDYQRLTDDIAHIRQGLKDYLSPSRAQPRDPVELSGNYTTEGRQP